MTNSLSSTDELTLEALETIRAEGHFTVLSPTYLDLEKVEEYDTWTQRKFILMMEAPAVEPKGWVPDPSKPVTRQMGDERRHWENQQRPRMKLPSSLEHTSRFNMEPSYPYVVAKRITAALGGWPTFCEWVHTQTMGKWSMRIYADVRKRPGHSFMIFHFEDQEAATLFKMFQL